jgi:hypothetical protein
MSWGEFQRAAPELAHAAKARFEATRLGLLGTLRADGSPRISPIEPYFTADELLIGAMASSPKARDLMRDPRCVLHSVVSEPDAGETEFKLYATALEVRGDVLRQARADAWWTSQPPELATVYALRVDEALRVKWALESGEMTVTRWSLRRGLEERTRSYP